MPDLHVIHVRHLGARLAAVGVALGALLLAAIDPSPLVESHRRRLVGSRGQATTEYALVLLAAALVALLVVAWATAGGGAGKITRLFNRVIDAVTGKI